MRTTLIIDDFVFRDAKKKAAATGQTLSELVTRALRHSLAEKAVKAKPWKMVTFGDPRAKKKHHTPADFYRMLEEEEMRPYTK